MKWKPTSKKRPRAAPAKSTATLRLTSRGKDGRVRLVLHRDSEGGQAFRLAAPLFEQRWQDVLAESVANITARRLGESPDHQATLDVAAEALEAFSGMCRGWLTKASNGEVACRQGCSHCCHQTVGVTPLEAFAIVAHLLRTRSDEELTELSATLGERVRETRGLSAAEQYSPRFPCVFLEDGACSIYEARPLVCRGMNSLDADACQRRMFDEVSRSRFLTAGEDGLCYLEPILGAKAVSAGLQFTLEDLFGVDMRPGDMHVVVEKILADARSKAPRLTQRWIAGEVDLFKSV